jgi:hypothetical protein
MKHRNGFPLKNFCQNFYGNYINFKKNSPLLLKMAEYNVICYAVLPPGPLPQFVAALDSCRDSNITLYPITYLGKRFRAFIMETDPRPVFHVINRKFTLDERYEPGKYEKRSLTEQEEKELIAALNGK